MRWLGQMLAPLVAAQQHVPQRVRHRLYELFVAHAHQHKQHDDGGHAQDQEDAGQVELADLC